MLILKRLLVITTLIVLLTGVTVPTIDVSADKKSDNDKRKQAKAWIKEKYENYKDYKKEQKEQKEKEKQYKKDKKEKEKQDKKYKKEKEKQDKIEYAKEKIKKFQEEQSQKRDDYKKEQREKDDDDDDDDDDDKGRDRDDDDDDDYKKEKDDDDDKKEHDDYELGQKFNCKFSGAYYSPEDLPLGQSIVSVGFGECTGFDTVISYGRLIVSDTLNDNDCYDVVSKSRSQSDTRGMKIFNKKGSAIYIEITGEQCFQNGNGDKITPTGICGRGIFPISTFDGKFTITNDAKGSGTFSSTVTYWVDRLGNSYCDSEYPLGSLFESKFNGSILLPVDNFAVPHTSFT